MPVLECTLVSEGPSDAVLIPLLEWLLQTHIGAIPIRVEWADLSRLRYRPCTLAEKLAAAIDLFPCHVLFVHRDADGQNPEWRYDEIRDAVAALPGGAETMPYVCIVPVRMTEAWLLVEERAIRRASGNPNGTTQLMLPTLGEIECVPNPKAVLCDMLRTASEMHGRRLKRFNAGRCARHVTAHMREFHKLRALAAFQRLEADVQTILSRLVEGKLPP